MKFLGKMYLMIILNVTQNKGFNSSLQNTVLGKPQGGGINLTTPNLLRVKRWALSFSRH